MSKMYYICWDICYFVWAGSLTLQRSWVYHNFTVQSPGKPGDARIRLEWQPYGRFYQSEPSKGWTLIFYFIEIVVACYGATRFTYHYSNFLLMFKVLLLVYHCHKRVKLQLKILVDFVIYVYQILVLFRIIFIWLPSLYNIWSMQM